MRNLRIRGIIWRNESDDQNLHHPNMYVQIYIINFRKCTSVSSSNSEQSAQIETCTICELCAETFSQFRSIWKCTLAEFRMTQRSWCLRKHLKYRKWLWFSDFAVMLCWHNNLCYQIFPVAKIAPGNLKKNGESFFLKISIEVRKFSIVTTLEITVACVESSSARVLSCNEAKLFENK